MTDAVRELLWFDRIIDKCINKKTISMDECFNKKIISERKLKSLLLVDNWATIDFVTFPIENNRTKHTNVKLSLLEN